MICICLEKFITPPVFYPEIKNDDVMMEEKFEVRENFIVSGETGIVRDFLRMNNIDIDEIVNGLFKETHEDLDTTILITNWDYRKMKIVSNGVCIDDQIAELYEKFFRRVIECGCRIYVIVKNSRNYRIIESETDIKDEIKYFDMIARLMIYVVVCPNEKMYPIIKKEKEKMVEEIAKIFPS